jgi:hypothetical protein
MADEARVKPIRWIGSGRDDVRFPQGGATSHRRRCAREDYERWRTSTTRSR